jgi:flagellar operon protein
LDNRFQIPNGMHIRPVGRPAPQRSQQAPGQQTTSFNQVLQQKLTEPSLKFSAHAQKRMAANGIRLSESDMKQLEDAVAKVEAKGGRESLILMRDLAFVVSVANKTVITAINHERLKDNVFTNIDSAVIS